MPPVSPPPTSAEQPSDGAGTAEPAPAEPPRRHLLRAAVIAALTAALLTPTALLIGRPPSTPQLTVIGTGSGADGALSILLEGAGGGRVLIGGGASGADLPAALARTAPPWRDRLDLLLVTDARDLPGATELVRRGRVGQLATVGLANERDPDLVALRQRCAASGVPLRAIGAGERIAIGRGEPLTLDVRPGDMGETPVLSLAGGGLSAAIVAGSDAPAGAPALAIVSHGSAERYRAALAGGARLHVAPAAPIGNAPDTATQLLLVAPGRYVTLGMAGANLRLRGGTPTALFPEPVP
jgi:hypothetical protein